MMNFIRLIPWKRIAGWAIGVGTMWAANPPKTTPEAAALVGAFVCGTAVNAEKVMRNEK